MSAKFNAKNTPKVSCKSAIDQKEPVARPKNCNRTDCPYGRGRTFCFPCMALILKDHKAAKKGD